MQESFDTRLARAADAVRALPGGEAIARDLLALAADVDGVLVQARQRLSRRSTELLQRWSDFVGESITAAYADGDTRLAIERRRIARLIASDSRWSGGYADALALVEQQDGD